MQSSEIKSCETSVFTSTLAIHYPTLNTACIANPNFFSFTTAAINSSNQLNFCMNPQEVPITLSILME